MRLGLQRFGLVLACAVPLSACAPTGFMADTWFGDVWPFGKQTNDEITDLDAAFAARAKQLMERNEERLRALRNQQSTALRQADDLSAEKKSLSAQLQAEREAAFLVQVDGGQISLNKLDNLAACDMLKSSLSGLPGTMKEMKPPMTSMFSVGSVSPYAPHHLLMSKCMAARDVPKL